MQTSGSVQMKVVVPATSFSEIFCLVSAAPVRVKTLQSDPEGDQKTITKRRVCPVWLCWYQEKQTWDKSIELVSISLRLSSTVISTGQRRVQRGAQGARDPPFSFPNYILTLNNVVIFTTLVHLREALSYYVGLPLKL